MMLRRFAALAVLMLLAACGGGPKYPPVTRLPALPAMSAQACRTNLDSHGVDWRKVGDFHNDKGCGIDEAVRVEHGGVAWNQALEMDCRLAVAVADFEAEVVQPEAQRWFGHKVTKMWNLGAYSCRGEDGRSSGPLSQHAYGLAIDIDGFDIEGGQTVRVERDWSGSDAKAQFLHAVAQGACRIFHGVLTPNADREHYNHIHMDLGPYGMCRV